MNVIGLDFTMDLSVVEFRMKEHQTQVQFRYTPLNSSFIRSW